MSKQVPSLDIIIVNWNSGKLLYDCLESILCTSRKGIALENVVVVDNGSSDDSLDGLEALDLPLTIIKKRHNMGFAKACNLGAKISKSEFILFLNPDTTLYEHSLDQPVRYFKSHINDKIGILGVKLLDEQGHVARSCSYFPSLRRIISQITGLDRFLLSTPRHFMTDWDHSDNRMVDQVMGAYYLVHRPLFDQLGGFDEQFFVYFEDVDFAYRAKKAGYHSFYYSEAMISHKGGGTSEQIKDIRLFYNLRSRILYSFKHFGRIRAWTATAMTLLIEPITRIVYSIYHRTINPLPNTLRAYARLYACLPNLLRHVSRHL